MTQSTELGTIYQQDELMAISKVAKFYGLKIHMDGARFFNALAYLADGTKVRLTTLLPSSFLLLSLVLVFPHANLFQLQ